MSRPSKLDGLGACYLMIVGLFYAIAGLFGIQSNGELIVMIAWNILISPYPLINYFEVTTNNYPSDLRLAIINDMPGSHHATSSIFVLICGAIATVAALALFQRKRWAAWIWAALLLVSFVLACGYVLAHVADPQFEIASSIRPFCLEASWIVAFLMARTETHVHTLTDRFTAGTREP